ncbi:TetR/AcrR family transcriptional regulator [Bacillaceae bacterium Marseille-Q3522]|nr:TetR/AcrR family transcriptional regulator [Bacillaceae bacterium Marseille-Q3522]
MIEKKLAVIEAAALLFSRKGYYATSTEEIARLSKVAKGSIYHYFESKEAILIAVYHYYHTKLFNEIRLCYSSGNSIRDHFKEELVTQIKFYFRHKDFISIQYRDQYTNENPEILNTFFEMKQEIFDLYKTRIEELYPGTKYSKDLSLILNGMIKEFLNECLFLGAAISIRPFVDYIFNRLDAISTSYHKEEEPIMKKNENETELAVQIVRNIRMKLEMSPVRNSKIMKSFEILDRLESIIGNQHDLLVVESLITYLASISIAPIKNEVKQLKQQIHLGM